MFLTLRRCLQAVSVRKPPGRCMLNGKTHWLWAFSTQHATYYVIDRSRASSVVLRF
jgi:hypothetical protein